MMHNLEIYNQLSQEFSEKITRRYSSSFSAAASLLEKPERDAIYAIYGFVRIADEIVDTWRPKDMQYYLESLQLDVKRTIKGGFSTNPIVHSFCATIRHYDVPYELVESFMRSMTMDINKKTYTPEEYKAYIYGSAEVVGLMCLMVFVKGSKRRYAQLVPAAKALGSAFQKINFLRDFSSDSKQLGRVYFPGKDISQFNEEDKNAIIKDINNDLRVAQKAIKKLPKSSRYGVDLAYRNFASLTAKIRRIPVDQLKSQRISLSKVQKITIYLYLRIKSTF